MSSSSEGGGEYRYDVRERRDDRLAGRGIEPEKGRRALKRSFVEKARQGAFCPRSLPLVLLNKKVEVGHVATWQVFIHKLAVSEAQVERLEGEAKALKQTHNGVELRLLVAEKEIESLKEDLQRLKQAQQETFNKELEGLRASTQKDSVLFVCKCRPSYSQCHPHDSKLLDSCCVQCLLQRTQR